MIRDYRWVAPFYDGLADLYSGGEIHTLKVHQLRHLEAGERVLYAGAGLGRDAAAAAEGGAHVTIVDHSPAMLTRAQARLARAHGQSECILADVRDHSRPGRYDVVVANFFLNVFASEEARQVLDHLAAQLRIGGKLLVGDFAPPRGGPVLRGLQQIYHAVPMSLFWILTGNALHPIHDVRLQASSRLEWIGVDEHRVFGHGPRWLRTEIAIRRAG